MGKVYLTKSTLYCGSKTWILYPSVRIPAWISNSNATLGPRVGLQFRVCFRIQSWDRGSTYVFLDQVLRLGPTNSLRIQDLDFVSKHPICVWIQSNGILDPYIYIYVLVCVLGSRVGGWIKTLCWIQAFDLESKYLVPGTFVQSGLGSWIQNYLDPDLILRSYQLFGCTLGSWIQKKWTTETNRLDSKLLSMRTSVFSSLSPVWVSAREAVDSVD